MPRGAVPPDPRLPFQNQLDGWHIGSVVRRHRHTDTKVALVGDVNKGVALSPTVTSAPAAGRGHT